ncbi:MAG: VTT domain-containing protein [Pseudomonadota bacterium]|nr:VTT domain-containing protein [Pseudomonadota bacterium]
MKNSTVFFLLILTLLMINIAAGFLPKQYLFDGLINSYEKYSFFIKDNHKTLACTFVLIYTLMLVFCLPLSVIFRIFAGFTFGVIGFFYSLFGSIAASYILFKIAKKNSISGARLTKKKYILKAKKMLDTHPYRYIIALRLIPLFPSWSISIASGVLQLNLSKFLSASCLGFIPNIAICTYIGMQAYTSKDIHNINFLEISLLTTLGIAYIIFVIQQQHAKK